MDLDQHNDIIAEIRELATQRRFCIKSQSRGDRNVESLIARFLGYHNSMDAADRKDLYKRAGRMRLHIEKGMPGFPDASEDTQRAVEACRPLVMLTANAREGWDSHRKQTEARMRVLARKLPGYSFVGGVKGVGDLGFAIIVGEAGDLSNYATKERLWKRLGLAVIGGIRQQRRSNADEALAHGYNPARRAEIWTLCSDAMFRHQWCSEDAALRDAITESPKWRHHVDTHDDEVPYDLVKLKGDELKAVAASFNVTAAAHPAGPYGEVYAIRRAATKDRGWVPAHENNDARRIMSKRFIRDLWRAWRVEYRERYGLPVVVGEVDFREGVRDAA